jgi:[phosphatase 2A protein]-leucine-carboxy methyltransferase
VLRSEIGTYTRTTALDRLVSSFVSGNAGRECQIISLGAGTDTRCFRLFSSKEPTGLIYHEIDFPSVTAKKAQLARAVPKLRAIIPVEESSEGKTWGNQQLPNGCQYWCHGRDLRELSQPDAKTLEGLRTDIPTLLISECCLCYLEVPDTKEVIRHFTDRIPSIAIILYEPIKPDDPFGKQMVSNLAARRIRMPTLDVYKSEEQQEARLKEAGFDQVKKKPVEDIWKRWISEDEKERVDRLEGLDEVEEWNLLAGHYIVAWGWRGDGFAGWENDRD